MFPRPGVQRDYPEGGMGVFCGNNSRADLNAYVMVMYDNEFFSEFILERCTKKL